VSKDVQHSKTYVLALEGTHNLKNSANLKDIRSTITQVHLVQEFKLASAFGQKFESGGGKAG